MRPPAHRKPHSLHVLLHPLQFAFARNTRLSHQESVPKTRASTNASRRDKTVSHGVPNLTCVTTTNSSCKACSYLHRATSTAKPEWEKARENILIARCSTRADRRNVPRSANNLDSSACIHPCRYACFCGAWRRASRNSCILVVRRLKPCQHKRGFSTMTPISILVTLTCSTIRVVGFHECRACVSTPCLAKNLSEGLSAAESIAARSSTSKSTSTSRVAPYATTMASASIHRHERHGNTSTASTTSSTAATAPSSMAVRMPR